VICSSYRRSGAEPPDVLLGMQDRFDTHFLTAPAWQQARSSARPASVEGEHRVSRCSPRIDIMCIIGVLR
jgi:hypothetical protein